MHCSVRKLFILSAAFFFGSLSAQTVITSGGVVNNVPKYSGSTSLGSSAIFEVNGNVGVGTSTPGFPLTVTGPGSAGQVYATSTANVGTISIGTFLAPNSPAGPGQSDVYVSVGTSLTYQKAGLLGYSQTNNTNGYAFLTTYGRPASDLVVASSGNVGIGIANPGADLSGLSSPPAPNAQIFEVNGDIALTQGAGGQVFYSDGTVQSTAWNGVLSGGDYAESVNVSGVRQEYEPGDVLVIDTASEGSFLKSSSPYSTTVTGIYSTRPGVVGRRQQSDRTHMREEVPMAMTGIVPVKASAENGQIKSGDLLVTSSRKGYAMKGTDRTQMLGAVIGKAIGHLDSGVGLIEAVVTLQ